MEENTSNLFDVCISVLAAAVFMLSFLPCCYMLYTGNFGGFNTQIEKTAEKTDGVLATPTDNTTPAEVLMIVAIADKYEPKPDKLNINGTAVFLCDTVTANTDGSQTKVNFEENRNVALSTTFNALDWSKTTGKLITAVGPDGQKEWRYIYG